MKKVGGEAFSEYLQNEGKDFILFKSDLLLRESQNDPIKRAEVVKDIVNSIAKVPDAFKRASYVSYTSTKLDMRESVMLDQITKLIKQQVKSKRLEQDRISFKKQQDTDEEKWIVQKSEDSVVQIIAPVITNDEYQERDLVRILINGGDKRYSDAYEFTIAHYLIENIYDDLETFDSLLYRKVFEFAKANIDAGREINCNLFTQSEDEEIASVAIDLLISPYVLADWESKGIYLQTQKKPEENFQRDAFQAIMRFKLRKVSRIIEGLKKEVKDGTISDEDISMHIKIIQQYTKERNEIANELNNVVF
jgi:DNA primase